MRILLALSIAIASSNAIPWAWDGIVTGKIASYDVVANGPNNFDLRIFLENGPALCTGGVNWAFINSTDPNYKTIATALISAKALGQQVTIYTAAYPYDTATFCKIGYITVS